MKEKIEQQTTFSLEKQFNNENAKKSGAIELNPEQQKTDIPTTIAPGFNANEKVFKDFALALSEKDRKILLINSPSGIDINKEDNIDGIPEAEMRKIQNLIKMLEEKNIEITDIVAHSEGAFYTVLAAKLYPEKFRNLVLVDPAGIIGKDNWKRLAMGTIHNTILEPMISNVSKEIPKTTVKDPYGSFKRFLAIAKADINEAIQEIRDLGIGVSVIHSVNDKIFPMDKVQENLARTEEEKKDDKHKLDGFYSVKVDGGTHNEIAFEPEKIALLIDDALDKMEIKMSKKEN
jgi:pimeloyl-ACP methyl ester carboxylesterase